MKEENCDKLSNNILGGGTFIYVFDFYKKI